MQSKETQLFGVLRTLVEKLNDKDEMVRTNVSLCLRNIAKNKPDEVLQTICTFKKSMPKMPTSEVAQLLSLAETICRSLNIDQVDSDTTLVALVDLAVQEMTHSNELIPEWQLPASQLLVAIGRNFCNRVMEGLVEKVQPGVALHYFVTHTLGSLAAANPLAMVPYIKQCLTTQLPQMGGLRSDHLRQAFAYCLARFADAISDYLANIDRVSDRTITKETFSTEMDLAFTTIANYWLPEAREPQMRDQILHAISSILLLLPPGRVEATAPGLLVSLLSLRKKKIPLPVGATRCLEAIISHPEVKAWPPIDQIVAALTELVMDAPDLEQPLTIKSHYEALRCFHTIDRHFPDKLSTFLSQHIKGGNEKDKATSLVILSHLASAGHVSHLSTLITAVGSLLDDPSLKVKRAVVKVIVVLAHKEVIHGNEGSRALQFIVSNCQHPGTSDESAELRQTCRDSLVLICTTAPHVAPVLAPILLRCFLLPEYNNLAGFLARCLALVHAKEPLDKPKLPEVLAKCIILIGAPFPEVGIYTLNLMKALSSCFEGEFSALLDCGSSKLIEELQDSEWSESLWEKSLINFMKSLVKAVTDSAWLAEFSDALTKIGQQDLPPENRNAQLSCLVSISVYKKDAMVASTLIQEALSASKQADCEKVCSSALGRCAGMDGEGHLQLTLAQLKIAAKDLPNPNMSMASKYMPSFFSSITGSDKSRKTDQIVKADRLRATLLLSYGEIAARIPGSVALLESTNVLEWMLDQISQTKDQLVLESGLVALHKIAESCSGLGCRDEALEVVMTQLKTGGVISLKCVAPLVKLPPALSLDVRIANMKKIFGYVIDENPEDAALSLALLNVPTTFLLSAGVNPGSLDEFITLLEPFIKSPTPSKRTTATCVLEKVLHTYADNLAPGLECPSSLCFAASLVALCIPRCTDINGVCRRSGVECIRLVLEINSFYLGESQRDVCKKLKKEISQEFLGKISNENDPDTLYQCSCFISELILRYLGNTQIVALVDSVMLSLTDPEVGGSAGVTVVLTALLKEKGQDLYYQVPNIINLYLKIVPQLNFDSVKTGAVVSMGSLARHHPKAVITALLNQPLPFTEACLSLWRWISKEEGLANEVCSNILCLLASNPLLEEPRDDRSPRVARAVPLAAVNGLCVMLSTESNVVHELSRSALPELLSALLIALAAYVGACPPVNIARKGSKTRSMSFVPNRDAYGMVPGRVALDACHALLNACGFSELTDTLALCRVDIGESLDSFMVTTQNLIRTIIEARSNIVTQLVSVINQNATSPEESTRITVVAVLSEVIKWPGCNAVLLEGLVQQLTASLDDENPSVRQLCLQGLSHIANIAAPLRERYVFSVLVALLQGLEETPGEGKAAGLATEALFGLAAVLPHVAKKQVGEMQSSLMFRVTPFLTKESVSVRVAAFRVFVQLILCGESFGGDAFLEQMPNVLINLLIGISDTDSRIVQDCYSGIQGLGRVLTEEKFTQAIKKLDSELSYEKSFKILIPSLAEAYPDLMLILLKNACGFTKSERAQTRACATSLIGRLCNFGDNSSFEMVSNKLTKLLNDPCAQVRATAAQSLSNLYMF
ncbi:maestro heat-like repeat-containing protein family member 1 [Neocloeon triangulifer]|uniref:maestro heat-like repeat-containing protein family member 1 n=1 Tax=Neocloeon triangulifer TaxID=2078957 RepID=UPI00286F433B|nr:maestro heat-like repeat-containing protein family member 1 [Neocloeon triangulifer]XP_059474984.1 maestro heat-like repeat-containing protein family member 1 [Neocloeon triangulifer]